MNNTVPNKKRLLENNKFVLLLSVILAFAAWIYITATAAPESEATISGITVNIPTENSAVGELGLDIISEIDTVSAKIKGPAYVVSGLSTEDISVTANLSNVTEAGNFRLDLRATKRSTNVSNEYEIVSISPSSINVTFDYIDTKQFSVIAKANGASAVEGLSAEDAIVANSLFSTISVKGPRKEIEKISKVVATADVNSVLDKTSTFTANLSLLDADNKELNKEKYTILSADEQPINKIEITVPILKLKQVPLKTQFVNAPAAYSTKHISHSLSISSILISGAPEIIDTISSVNLSAIDFDSISNENYVFDASIILPEGVKCADNIDTVQVTINNINTFVKRTFDVSKIKVSGGSNEVSLVRNIRNVKILGPEKVMKEIKAENLYAVIDITGKQAGQHTVTVRIECNTSNAIWQVGTYTASILIK